MRLTIHSVQHQALPLWDQDHQPEALTSDLHQAAVRRTQTIVPTHPAVAVAVVADSKPHLETTTPTHPRTTAAHHSVAHKAVDALACRADRACAELVCTYSNGAFGVVGYS